jgi:hypothetical protein
MPKSHLIHAFLDTLNDDDDDDDDGGGGEGELNTQTDMSVGPNQVSNKERSVSDADVPTSTHNRIEDRGESKSVEGNSFAMMAAELASLELNPHLKGESVFDDELVEFQRKKGINEDPGIGIDVLREQLGNGELTIDARTNLLTKHAAAADGRSAADEGKSDDVGILESGDSMMKDREKVEGIQSANACFITNDATSTQQSNTNTVSENADPVLWGALLASVVTKRAAEKAFALKKRSMTTPDVIECLGEAFESVECA